MKGAAAYAEHARVLGHEDPALYAFFHEALASLTNPNPTVASYLPVSDVHGGNVPLSTEDERPQETSAVGHPCGAARPPAGRWAVRCELARSFR